MTLIGSDDPRTLSLRDCNFNAVFVMDASDSSGLLLFERLLDVATPSSWRFDMYLGGDKEGLRQKSHIHIPTVTGMVWGRQHVT